MFQSDAGKEFDQTPMHDFFLKHGIYFRKFCPNTHQQNGVAEWKHRHLLAVTHSFVIDASFPTSFWLDALYAAVFTISWLAAPVLHSKSPNEALLKKNKFLTINFSKLLDVRVFLTLHK